MKHRTATKLSLITLTALLFLINTAQASVCYTQSPNYASDKKNYFTIDKNSSLSAEEKKSLHKLFKSIKGKWEGVSTNTLCKGPFKNSREETQKIKKRTKISTPFIGQLELRSTNTNLTTKTVKNNTLKINTKSRGLTLDSIGTHTTKITQKYRTINTNGGNRFIEKSYEITKSDDYLNITIKSYANGYLGSVEKWNLH